GARGGARRASKGDGAGRHRVGDGAVAPACGCRRSTPSRARVPERPLRLLRAGWLGLGPRKSGASMSETVAERYARAIFEVGEEAGNLATVAQHFEAFAQAYEGSHALRVALNDPVVDDAARQRVLAAVASRLGLCREAKNAVAVMLQRRRLSELGATARLLTQLSDEQPGVLRAEVTSPSALSDGYARELTSELEKVTGQRVVLVQRTDPTLIAGVVLRIGSQVVDGSLRGRLDEFERRLARAS